MPSYSFTVSTKKPIELIDITSSVRDYCAKEKIQNCLLVVSCLHTTGAVCINEKCEELEKDFHAWMAHIAPPGKNYHHDHSAIDGRANAHSHLLKYFMNSSETLIIKNGELQLGTWQSLFFVELDGPRPKREILLTLIEP